MVPSRTDRLSGEDVSGSCWRSSPELPHGQGPLFNCRTRRSPSIWKGLHSNCCLVLSLGIASVLLVCSKIVDLRLRDDEQSGAQREEREKTALASLPERPAVRLVTGGCEP